MGMFVNVTPAQFDRLQKLSLALDDRLTRSVPAHVVADEILHTLVAAHRQNGGTFSASAARQGAVTELRVIQRLYGKETT